MRITVTGPKDPIEDHPLFFVPKTRRSSKTERRFARLSADAPRSLVKGETARYDGLNYNRKEGVFMKSKWIAVLCILALALTMGAAAYASGEASGASQTRGDVMDVTEPETAADYILSAFSCKSFTDEAVPDEVLEDIVAAGITAPSAINGQPWKFILVKDEALKTSLVRGAPAVIIVAVPEEDYNPGGNSQFAAGCAAEAMYLYAQAIGLGAHMYTAPVAMTIAADPAAYGIPEGYEAAVVLAFGYYDDFVDAASGASVRNEYGSFVSVLE